LYIISYNTDFIHPVLLQLLVVATISSTLCTIEYYLYLHDLCVFWCVLVYAFMYFYVYVGQVPEIKLMMMMIAHFWTL